MAPPGDVHDAATAGLDGAPSDPGPLLASGERLGQRYVILRFLARGGMGEVYEAEDVELKARVALKTIRPGLASRTEALDRFKREIALARRVTHPGVCRIFDLGRASHAGRDVVFLTMELLAGETLAERLRRGPIREAEALPIATGMAEALQAAHQAGVVHRDLKPGNIMLVPAGEGPARVVVTDFGLARDLPEGEPGDASTASLGSVGTPAYMAPEQVQGGPTTPATDVYALGLVLYEMLAGVRPFAADTPLATATRRLTEPPPPLRQHAPTVDPRWERTIERCLAVRPADRFARAEDVLAALRGRPVAARPGRLGPVLLLGLALVLAASAWWALRPGAAPRAPVARRSVAVLGFKNATADPRTAWLSTAFAEMLTTELGAGENLRTIPGETVARMRAELGLPEAETLAPETLARARGILGCDIVVLGSYTAVNDQIRLDLRAQSGTETVASLAETGTEAQLFDLVRSAGARLRTSLGVQGLPADEAQALRATSPGHPGAARLYAEGLAALRRFDHVAARDLLEQATAAEPQFALAHTALAATWENLGYQGRAAASARRAVELSAGLSRQERLWIEGRHHEVSRDWPRAIEAYGALFRFFPDNLEYGFRLAAVQVSGNRLADALATVEALRRLPPPASDDPRVDLAEAAAANIASEFPRARAAAARAAERAAGLGAILLQARARVVEGRALVNLGELKAALSAYAEAHRLYTAGGDRAGAARTTYAAAIVTWQQGDVAGAARAYEEALRTFEEIGDRSDAAQAVNYLGITQVERRQLDQALASFERALQMFRELGDEVEQAWCLGNQAEILRLRADLPVARRRLDESVALFRKVGDRRGLGVGLLNVGGVLVEQGELAQALPLLREGLRLEREIRHESYTGWALVAIGRVLALQGDLPGARRSFDEALAIRTRLGEKATLAETRAWLGWLAVEEGEPARGEALAREAVAAYAELKTPEDEALASVALARALLAQGRPAEAQQVADRASALMASGQARAVRLFVAIEAARAAARPGPLAEVLAEARHLGLRWVELEARLAHGELRLASARDAARGELRTLAGAAEARGFGLIARKAQALAGR